MHRDLLPIAEPCHAPWDAMTGDDLRRRCDACDKHVHDLSAMRHDDAVALLRARAGDPPCVRYTTALDGTLRFRDLVPRASLTRKLRTAVAATLLAACTHQGEARSPEPDPSSALHAPVLRSDRPQNVASPADACDPADPTLLVAGPATTADGPRALTLEQQQQAADVDRALREVQHRLNAIEDTSPVFMGKITVDLEKRASDLARNQAAADAAEHARLLELEAEAEALADGP